MMAIQKKSNEFSISDYRLRCDLGGKRMPIKALRHLQDINLLDFNFDADELEDRTYHIKLKFLDFIDLLSN